jgi:peptidoglycan glycosyltransferase
LQLAVARIVKRYVDQHRLDKAAAVVIDPATGDVLAMVSYPWFSQEQLRNFVTHPPDLENNELINAQLSDNARDEANFPGSTFKIVSAIAALRRNPDLANKAYHCERLDDGRAGVRRVEGYGRVRDDETDNPHDDVNLSKGIRESCNAYFAQLTVLDIGEAGLWDTARAMGMQFAERPIVKLYNSRQEPVDVNMQTELHRFLPQASYGQYPVKATPFQMSQAAATIANRGTMMPARYLLNEANDEPLNFIGPDSAGIIAAAMRSVVTGGTARGLAPNRVPIAGKTGTAEVPHENSHSWFIGFAPYQGRRPLAFAVFFENGGYGSRVAAPAAGEIVTEAFNLRLLE